MSAAAVDNPYLTEASKYIDVTDTRSWWQRCVVEQEADSQIATRAHRLVSHFEARWSLVKEYSFSIPTPELIQAIVDWSPVCEVMAGTGYLAKLVAQSGGDIVATDSKPCNPDYFKRKQPWFEVEKMDGVSAVRLYPDRTLLMSWPWMDADCLDILKTFEGHRFIYIGEPEGGCNGIDQFFRTIEKEWTEVREVRLPQWEGLNDRALFYERAAVKTRGIDLE